MANSKNLTSKDKQRGNYYTNIYQIYINSCSMMLKLCEENNLRLFGLEEVVKRNKPFKILRKSYKEWNNLMTNIQTQKQLNDKKYMECLKRIEEILDEKF